jgi:hypothetical protein
MGYQTEFRGELKFNRELTGSELAFLKSMFWIDDDKMDGYIVPEAKPHYVQLCLTDDFTGIKWDGSEKFYKAVEAVNFIIVNMKARYPDFALTGRMTAQGEDFEDRWELVVGEDGLAHQVDTPLAGRTIRCPHCDQKISVDEAEAA